MRQNEQSDRGRTNRMGRMRMRKCHLFIETAFFLSVPFCPMVSSVPQVGSMIPKTTGASKLYSNNY